MARVNRAIEHDAVADAIARGIPVKKLGYFETMNRRPEFKAGAFKTAGPDEELLERPVYCVFIITDGPATITVNGTTKMTARKVYADGVHEYECKSIAQTPEGQRPGLRSIKINEGAAYQIKIDEMPTGGSILY